MLKNFQGKLPLLLAISFISGIFIFSFIRLKNIYQTELFWPSLITIAFYILWIAIEIKTTTTKELDSNKSEHDKGTLEFYAFGRGLTVLLALSLQSFNEKISLLHYIGFALFVFFVWFRLYAIKFLGKYYSHRVRIRDDHQIITSGPYSIVRHPAYTGMLFAHLGFVLFFFNFYALGALILIFTPGVIKRILVEEIAVLEIPGYSEYKNKKKGLIPFIW